MTVREFAAAHGLSMKQVSELFMVTGLRIREPKAQLAGYEVDRLERAMAGRSATGAPPGPTVALAPGVPVAKVRAGRSGTTGAAIALVLVVGLCTFGLFAMTKVHLPLGKASVNVAPGDCFAAPGLLASEIDAGRCDSQHPYEAFAVIDLAGAFPSYPGEPAVRQRVEERCGAIGSDLGIEAQYFYYFYPRSQSNWDQTAGRTAVCATKSSQQPRR